MSFEIIYFTKKAIRINEQLFLLYPERDLNPHSRKATGF